MQDTLITIVLNLVSSFIFLLFVDYYNKRNVKNKIIKDFRTEEILSETLLFERYNLLDLIDTREIKVLIKGKSWEQNRRIKSRIIKFYEKKKYVWECLIMIINSNKTNILYEMVEHTFHIFNDFKLLEIVNHMKNRRCNFEENVLEKLESEKNMDRKYDKLKAVTQDIIYYYYYFNKLVEELGYIRKFERMYMTYKNNKGVRKILDNYSKCQTINAKIDKLTKMKPEDILHIFDIYEKDN